MVSLLIHWFINGSKLSVDEFSKLVIEITGLQSVKILKVIYGKVNFPFYQRYKSSSSRAFNISSNICFSLLFT